MKKEHDVRIDRNKLHPWLDYKLGLLLRECGKQGIYLIITEGFRTVRQQNALYAKGRTKPGNIVTNAKGSTYSSQHMWGIAFDIAINDSKKLYDQKLLKQAAKIGKSKKVGLGWGGDWKSFPDSPHFYLKKWGSTTGKLKRLYGTPKEFEKTWRRTVNRKKGLLVYQSAKKDVPIKRVPNGKKVKVMYFRNWYAKVLLANKTPGYMNKEYLK